MSAWRKTGIDFLPQFRHAIESAENPMALWIQLFSYFDDAYAQSDFSTIGSIYGYASWCIGPRSGHLPNETSAAAMCAFYEHIPLHEVPCRDMHKWITAAEFKMLRSHLEYHVGKGVIDDIYCRISKEV